MSGWYLSRGGQQSGPHDDQQIQQMAQQGQLGPDAYISGPGLNGWTPASQAPVVAQALGGPPQAAAAPPAQQQPAPYQQPAPHQQAAPYQQPQQPQQAQQAAAPHNPYAPAPGPAYAAAGGGAYAAVATAGAASGAAPVRQSSWVMERLKGLGAVAIAFAVLGLNVYTIVSSGTFYPKTIILGLGAIGYGGWVVIFGDEYDDFTMELVRWKQIGMYGCGALGVLAGIAISVLIAD